MRILFEISKFIKIRHTIKPQLGRWNIDDCIKKTNRKIDLSNEDHCGPCGQYIIKEGVKSVEAVESYLKLNNIKYEKNLKDKI